MDVAADANARKLGHGNAIKVLIAGFLCGRRVRLGSNAGWHCLMRDGWAGLNRVTSGSPVLPLEAHFFSFTVGQSNYGAQVK